MLTTWRVYCDHGSWHTGHDPVYYGLGSLGHMSTVAMDNYDRASCLYWPCSGSRVAATKSVVVSGPDDGSSAAT